MLKSLYFLIIVILSSLLISCEDIENHIPDRPVDISVNPIVCGLSAIPSYKIFDRNTHGIAGVHTFGYCGVIVVHTSPEKYYAFDLSCSNDDCIGTPLEVLDKFLLTFKCPKCGEVYNLYSKNGLPTKNISKHLLTSYNVTINGFTNISIRN